jgi:hypothetical protein
VGLRPWPNRGSGRRVALPRRRVAPSVIQKAPDVYVQSRDVGGQEYSFRQVSDLAAGMEHGRTGRGIPRSTETAT